MSGELARFAALLPSLQRASRFPASTRRRCPAPTPTSTPTTPSTTPATPTRGPDDRHQPPQRRGGPARQGDPTAPAQERHAGQVRQDHGGIADELIDEDQQHYVVFDAFFGNVMFHEVAHGWGSRTRSTAPGRCARRCGSTPRRWRKARRTWWGLHMVTQLFERGELTEHSVEHHYVTFLAGIFRSVRSAPRAPTAARTWCASTTSASMAPSAGTRRPGVTGWTSRRCGRRWRG